MSQRPTKSSRSGRTKTSRKASTGGGSLVVFDSMWTDLLAREARAVHKAGDPLEAEVFASHVIGMLRRTTLVGESDPVAAIGGRLVAAAGRSRSPEGRMFVTAIAAVASGELARKAAAALSQSTPPLASSSAHGWVSSIGRAEPTSAWRASDLCGDQDSVMIGFRYPDGAEHTLLVLVDHLMGGIAKDATVLVTPVDAVLPGWEEEAGTELVEEPIALAAGRVVEAIEMTEITVGAPVTDDYGNFSPLVKARLEPIAEEVPEPQALTDAEIEKMVKAFLADPSGAHLAHDQDAWFLIDALIDFRCGPGLDPLRWSGGAAEVFLMGYVPRNISAPESLLARAGEVLSAWVPWAARRAGLPAEYPDGTLALIDELGTEPLEALRDTSRWGASKKVAMQMLDAGIDLSDDEVVAEWLARHAGARLTVG